MLTNRGSKLRALTRRQLEVLRLAALPDKEIGRRLGIAGATARNHLSNARQKLGAKDRLTAVIIALQRGLVTVDELVSG